MGKQHKVGYGNPPLHSRWKPGQSGNPKGRSRTMPSLASIIERELSERVKVLKKGREKSIPALRYLVSVQKRKAAKGDLPALKWLLANAPTQAGEVAEELLTFTLTFPEEDERRRKAAEEAQRHCEGETPDGTQNDEDFR